MSDQFGSTRPAADDLVSLEAALLDLGGALHFGPTPDIAGAVRDRLVAGRTAAGAAGPVAERWWSWRPVPRAAAIALLIILVLAGLAAAAIGFGLPGLRIVFTEASPSPSAAGASAAPSLTSSPGFGSTPVAVPTINPSVAFVDLGKATTLEGARRTVDFSIYAPSAAIVGSAAPRVFESTVVPDGQVTLVYPPGAAEAPPSPKVQAADGTVIGLLITESRGSIDEGYLQKGIGPGTTVQPVVVNGRAGWWITGRPHTLFTVDADGHAYPETLRDVGDVLAWVQGGTLIRIESARGLAETLRIAESMQ